MSKKMVPEIRFKGFTDDWKERKLGELMQVTSVKRVHQADWRDHGVRFLRARDIVAESNNDEIKDMIFISEERYEEFSKISGKLRIGDLLVTGVGTIGVSKLIKTDEKIYFKDGNIIWFKNENILDGNFLYYSFNNDNIQKFIKKSAGKGTVGTYTIENGKKTPIVLPKKKLEQEKIGQYFNDLDHLITLHQRKLDLMKSTKKTMLNLLFPRNREKNPRVRFKGFKDDWEQRKLGELVDVYSGRDYKHLSKGSIPVYGTGGYMLSVSEALSYDRDAIGIGRKGTIDNPYILKAPFWTVDTLFYSIPKEKNDLYFIFDVFQKINWKRKDESTGVPSLSKTTINNIHVYTPEYYEQTKIGQYFSYIDQLITHHKRQLELLKDMKKTLLKRMFV